MKLISKVTALLLLAVQASSVTADNNQGTSLRGHDAVCYTCISTLFGHQQNGLIR